ncbi:MAG: PorV/PorQ family protein, partial [bacterium]
YNNAWYTNPAGINHNSSSFSISHAPWLQDTKGNLISYILSREKFAIGLSIDHFYISDIPYAGVDGKPDELNNFYSHDVSLGVTFGMPYKKYDFGICVKIIQEFIYTENCNGMGFDFGIIRHDIIRNVSLGISLLNIGWSGKFLDERVPLPASLKAGMSYSRKICKRNNFSLMADVHKDILISPQDYMDNDSITYKAENLKTWFPLGAQYTFRDFLFLRAGYALMHRTKIFSTGFGIKFLRYGFDYAFSFYKEDQGMPHVFGISIIF